MIRALCLLALVVAISAAPQKEAEVAYEGPLDVADKPQATPEDLPLENKKEGTSDELESDTDLEEVETDRDEEKDRETEKEDPETDKRDRNESRSPNAEPSNVNELTTPNYKPETPKKVPTARFLSKLSYFKNNDDEDNNLLNFIERTSKRHFRSRCRCEKITNCPKLQISVPRCPQDLFMCCF